MVENGWLCHGLLAYHLTAKIYILVSQETYKWWPIFVNNCYVSVLRLIASVFGCRWPRWKRVATREIEAKLFNLFPRVFERININGRGLFSLCPLRLYLPLDAER